VSPPWNVLDDWAGLFAVVDAMRIRTRRFAVDPERAA
jgi:hypothetical protein